MSAAELRPVPLVALTLRPGQGRLEASTDDAIIERTAGMRSLVISDGGGWAVQDHPEHCGYELTRRP
jgi:hypothetical protein